MLLATGHRPATAGLNLEAAGIETDDRGAVRVDAHLRTTAPRVFAAGDVTGGLQFTYVSLDDFRIIRDVLLGDGARTTANRGPVPYSVFIEPTLSHVGMHEEEARKAGRDIRVNRIAVAAFRVRGYWVRRRVCSKPSSTPRPTRYWGARSSEPNRAKSSTPSPQP